LEIGLNLDWLEPLDDPEVAAHIRDLGVTWAKLGANVTSPMDRPRLRKFLEGAAGIGLRCVIDLRTSAEELRDWAHELRAEYLGKVPNEELSGHVFSEQYKHLAEGVGEIVADNADLCQDWEWWGEADCPHISGGAFRCFEYGLSLQAVYDAAKAANPDCRVWTGGFGVNANLRFLEDMVKAYCETCRIRCDPRMEECPKCGGPLMPGSGKHFDVCNLHHYAHQRQLDSVLNFYEKQLTRARTWLDGKECSGQPFASTEWGLPTAPTRHIPPWLNSYVFGEVHAVRESEAAEWYDAMFALFERHGFEVVCVHTLRDLAANPTNFWGGYCGLMTEYPLDSEPSEGLRKKLHWETVQKWAHKGREKPAFE